MEFEVVGGDYRQLLLDAGPESERLLGQPGLEFLQSQDHVQAIDVIEPAIYATSDLASWYAVSVTTSESVGGSIAVITESGQVFADRYLDSHSPDSHDGVMFGRLAGTDILELEQRALVGMGTLTVLGRTNSKVLVASGGHGPRKLLELPDQREVGSLAPDELAVSAARRTSGEWTVYGLTSESQLITWNSGTPETRRAVELAERSVADDVSVMFEGKTPLAILES